MNDDAFFKEIQHEFLIEASENLSQSEELFLSLEKSGLDHGSSIDSLKRLAHNFKGSGKAVGFEDLSSFSHKLENLLIALGSGKVSLQSSVIDLLLKCNDALKADLANLMINFGYKNSHDDLILEIENALSSQVNELDVELVESGPSISQTLSIPVIEEKNRTVGDGLKKEGDSQVTDNFIRLPLKKIDNLLNAFGEQVIFLSTLDHLKDDLVANENEIIQNISNLKKIAFDLQQSMLALRMVNLKSLFGKLERVARDSARMTNKKVVVSTLGEESELDKTIVEKLSDPLTHMIRNAVDHGIENSEERDKSGKIDMGFIELKAHRQGASFVIEIRDDGRGIDPEKIRAKAIQKKIISEDSVLSRVEIFDLIFANDFSTKEQVSELSGRGVGMSVVKEMIQQMKGTYEIESEVGIGTTFRIRLPMSLSLYNGLIVQIADEKFIVPCSQVGEIVEASQLEFIQVGPGQASVRLRESVIEYFDLASLLKVKSSVPTCENKVVLFCEIQNRKIALGISKVLRISRVVQKNISPEMRVCLGATGLTVLGDGLPALILDLNEIVSYLHSKHLGRAS